MLIVRPKLSQALESLSISSGISCSLLSLRAQSSAKRKSLITVSFIFVTACRRLRLNNFPSSLFLILMPVSEMARNGEKRHNAMIVAGMPVSFALVDVDDCGVSELLG